MTSSVGPWYIYCIFWTLLSFRDGNCGHMSEWDGFKLQKNLLRQHLRWRIEDSEGQIEWETVKVIDVWVRSVEAPKISMKLSPIFSVKDRKDTDWMRDEKCDRCFEWEMGWVSETMHEAVGNTFGEGQKTAKDTELMRYGKCDRGLNEMGLMLQKFTYMKVSATLSVRDPRLSENIIRFFLVHMNPNRF